MYIYPQVRSLKTSMCYPYRIMRQRTLTGWSTVWHYFNSVALARMSSRTVVGLALAILN